MLRDRLVYNINVSEQFDEYDLKMVNKIVYPNVVALLKAECPVLYSNYVKIIEEDIKHNEVSELPLKYLETDIYRVSREVKKMQRINDNILTAWYEVDSGRYIDIEYNI